MWNMSANQLPSTTARGEPNCTPNAALQAAAGDHAGAVARVFPRPHAPYLAANAARRHLIQLILSLETRDHFPADLDLGDALATWSAGRLIAALVPAPPLGLSEALKKLGDTAMAASDYATLCSILRNNDETARTLRHMRTINPTQLYALQVAPPELRRHRIMTILNTREEFRLLAAVVTSATLQAPDPARARDALADRLERATSAQGLFRMLVAAVDIACLAPMPIPGTQQLRPITTEQDMITTGRRFRNCLSRHVRRMVTRHHAYFEYLGEEAAIVSIHADQSRYWHVGCIAGPENARVSDETRDEIEQQLALLGVITRYTPSSIRNELEAETIVSLRGHGNILDALASYAGLDD